MFFQTVVPKNKRQRQYAGGGIAVEKAECTDIYLQTLATILIRSFLFGLAFLLLWAVLYLIAPGWLFEINVKWFDIGKRDFDLINYFGMGFMKISILLFFLIPYLAIKSMLRRKERKSSRQ